MSETASTTQNLFDKINALYPGWETNTLPTYIDNWVQGSTTVDYWLMNMGSQYFHLTAFQIDANGKFVPSIMKILLPVNPKDPSLTSSVSYYIINSECTELAQDSDLSGAHITLSELESLILKIRYDLTYTPEAHINAFIKGWVAWRTSL